MRLRQRQWKPGGNLQRQRTAFRRVAPEEKPHGSQVVKLHKRGACFLGKALAYLGDAMCNPQCQRLITGNPVNQNGESPIRQRMETAFQGKKSTQYGLKAKDGKIFIVADSVGLATAEKVGQVAGVVRMKKEGEAVLFSKGADTCG